jgi:hypothetical protein
VSLEGACSYGTGLIEVETVAAAPEVNGLRLVGDTCTITVSGIGAKIAQELSVKGETLEYVADPRSIWLAPLQICPACIPCPCPVPLPLLFAGDGAVDPGEALPPDLRTVRVSRGELLCAVPEGDAGCGTESFELDVAAILLETGGDFDVAPVLLGSVSVAEGEEAVEPGSGLIVRSLRATGPNAKCLGISESEAAWVVHRPSAPTL